MPPKNIKKIHSAIKKIGNADKFEIYSGKVDAINEANTTIDVAIDNGLIVYDVRLRAVITDTTGMWVLPKQNSDVVIARIDGTQDFALMQASEIDKLFVKIGDTTLQLDSTGVTINGGANEGMVKVAALVTKLNALETKVNQIITAFNTWIVTPNDGGAALKVLAASFAALLTATTQANLENTKAKH